MTEDWDALVRAVVGEWSALSADEKAALILAYPDLYAAISNLARHGRFTFDLD